MSELKVFLEDAVSKVTDQIFKFASPYNLKELREIRYNLLKEMKQKKFTHYYGLMQDTVKRIDEIALNDMDVLDDNYWSMTMSTTTSKTTYETFWQRESPVLREAFRKKEGFLIKPFTGVSRATDMVLSDKFVHQLIGDPFWMTIQQKILFRALIGSYFTKNMRLWPVNLNMDMVYRKTLDDIRRGENVASQGSGSRSRVLTQDEIDEMVRLWKPPTVDATAGPQVLDEAHVEILRERYRQQLVKYNAMTREQKRKANALERILTAALAGSGPFILKILQQINTANENMIDGQLSVAELTKDLFSNIPGLTTREAQFVRATFAESAANSSKVEQLVEPAYQKNFSVTYQDRQESVAYVQNMQPGTLGSASIAEAHLTHFEDQGAVIKFIKPMYAFYYLCEMDFLLHEAWREIAVQVDSAMRAMQLDAPTTANRARRRLLIVQCRKLMMFFIKQFAGEFDYKNEWINTTRGFSVYNMNTGPVHSIVAYDIRLDPFPYLVLQQVEGLTVDKILKKPNSQYDIKNVYKLIYDVIDRWFSITLWGDGFFHADLHPGNAIVQPGAESISLIDFGSCGTLSKRDQCYLVEAMIISGKIKPLTTEEKTESLRGREIHRENVVVARRFVKKIWDICGVNQDKLRPEHLNEVVDKILHYRTPPFFSTMFLDIVEFSDDIGLCISNDILMFGRATAYLSSMIMSVTSRCQDAKACPAFTINDIVTRNVINDAKRNPSKLIPLLLDRDFNCAKRYK